jgi:hypothetical protein
MGPSSADVSPISGDAEGFPMDAGAAGPNTCKPNVEGVDTIQAGR